MVTVTINNPGGYDDNPATQTLTLVSTIGLSVGQVLVHPTTAEHMYIKELTTTTIKVTRAVKLSTIASMDDGDNLSTVSYTTSESDSLGSDEDFSGATKDAGTIVHGGGEVTFSGTDNGATYYDASKVPEEFEIAKLSVSANITDNGNNIALGLKMADAVGGLLSGAGIEDGYFINGAAGSGWGETFTRVEGSAEADIFGDFFGWGSGVYRPWIVAWLRFADHMKVVLSHSYNLTAWASIEITFAQDPVLQGEAFVAIGVRRNTGSDIKMKDLLIETMGGAAGVGTVIGMNTDGFVTDYPEIPSSSEVGMDSAGFVG